MAESRSTCRSTRLTRYHGLHGGAGAPAERDFQSATVQRFEQSEAQRVVDLKERADDLAGQFLFN